MSQSVSAQSAIPAFSQAVAEHAAEDKDIAMFYRSNGYQSLWTGDTSVARKRRAALLDALEAAHLHGLPSQVYSAETLRSQMRSVETPRARGALEVEMTRVFLLYARDIQTGVTIPSRIDEAIVRKIPYRDRTSYLINLANSEPHAFFESLPPNTREYNALMKARFGMERQLQRGGWGAKVPTRTLKPGARGDAVVALRNRLIAMGFMDRSNNQAYDSTLEAAVRGFQLAHGLEPDGVAGPGTLSEINKSVEDRLQSIIVALERERWMNRDRGERHILVNLPDFTAKVIDHGKVTFETRSVVGARSDERPTPEFSDVMEFMVINPSWYVPRSIATKEYLPELKQNPFAVSHIEITDNRGRLVNRNQVDFNQYTAASFPYAMRQPPSRGNALGLVKFMFPNKYNIYLHDTPHKNLFGREVRAYSHGCVRLADPFDFAYTLLGPQTENPVAYFQSVLQTEKETRVNIVDPVPVHIIYRTAFTTPKGHTQFRRDIYGRDAKVWRALENAGVALIAAQG